MQMPKEQNSFTVLALAILICNIFLDSSATRTSSSSIRLCVVLNGFTSIAMSSVSLSKTRKSGRILWSTLVFVCLYAFDAMSLCFLSKSHSTSTHVKKTYQRSVILLNTIQRSGYTCLLLNSSSWYAKSAKRGIWWITLWCLCYCYIQVNVSVVDMYYWQQRSV